MLIEIPPQLSLPCFGLRAASRAPYFLRTQPLAPSTHQPSGARALKR